MVTKIKPIRMNTSGSWTPWDNLAYQTDSIFDRWAGGGVSYNAWPGIYIGDYSDYSAMRWPCQENFHIPTKENWETLFSMMWTLWIRDESGMLNYLKMPEAWMIMGSSWSVSSVGNDAYYWSCTPAASTVGSGIWYSYNITELSIWMMVEYRWRSNGLTIRPFKDNSVQPDSSWTRIFDGTSIAEWAWVYHNQIDWLISISDDGETRLTISDKNLGADTVYSNWDTLSQSNCWNYYQRWNNYWFPFTWPTTTSTTLVDASTYWP